MKIKRTFTATLILSAISCFTLAGPTVAGLHPKAVNFQVDAVDFTSATQGWIVVNRQPVWANHPPKLYVYSTTTSGRMWRRVAGPLRDLPPSTMSALSVSFSNGRDGVMLFSLGAGACQAEMATLATTDGGKTWRRDGGRIIASDGVTQVLSRADGSAVLANGGCATATTGLSVGTHGTWTPTVTLNGPKSFGRLGVPPTAVSLSFHNVSHGLVVTAYETASQKHPTLIGYATTDGGARWVSFRLGGSTLPKTEWGGAVSFVNAKNGVVVTSPGYGVFTTHDGGATWTAAHKVVLHNPRYGYALDDQVADADAFVVLGSNWYARAWRTTDGGVAWTPMRLPH